MEHADELVKFLERDLLRGKAFFKLRLDFSEARLSVKHSE